MNTTCLSDRVRVACPAKALAELTQRSRVSAGLVRVPRPQQHGFHAGHARVRYSSTRPAYRLRVLDIAHIYPRARHQFVSKRGNGAPVKSGSPAWTFLEWLAATF